MQQQELKKREAEKLEQLRMKAIQQQQSSTSKVELKYHASTAVRPGQGFGYGQVTTGQVSSRKYEILTRASSAGPEDRGGLNPDLIRAQSEQRKASPAPMGKAMVSSEVDASQQIASQQMMARTQFSKQADFASTTAALSTGLTRRQTTSVSKMASSEMKSVSSMSSQQMSSMSSSSQFASSSQSSSFSSSVQQTTSGAQQS